MHAKVRKSKVLLLFLVVLEPSSSLPLPNKSQLRRMAWTILWTKCVKASGVSVDAVKNVQVQDSGMGLAAFMHFSFHMCPVTGK